MPSATAKRPPARATDDLAPMLEELLAAGELPGTGFSAADLDDVMRRLAGLEDPPKKADPGARLERAAELQRQWGTARGQLWRAGNHRLLCGDSTDAQAWARLMAGRKAALVFTDPPYGVQYESPSGKFRPMAGDDLTGDAFVAFLTKAFANLAAHADDRAAWYVWHASATRDEFLYALKAAGIRELQYLIWAKPAALVGTSDYRWAHEPCFYAAKADRRPRFYGGATQETLWRVGIATAHGPSVVVGAGMAVWDGKGSALYVTTRIPKARRLRQVRLEPGTVAWLHDERAQETVWEVAREGLPEHPTQKPAELGRRAMLNSSKPGEAVADGFCGSGSMLVAAEQIGRHGHGIEYEPGYVAVALERLAGLGLTPEQEK